MADNEHKSSNRHSRHHQPLHISGNQRCAETSHSGLSRVSTDNEEQLTSYEAQVDYYTNYIKSREDWEFVSVYTDEETP